MDRCSADCPKRHPACQDTCPLQIKLRAKKELERNARNSYYNANEFALKSRSRRSATRKIKTMWDTHRTRIVEV